MARSGVTGGSWRGSAGKSSSGATKAPSTLAPAYPAALQWIEDANLEQPTANAHLAPLPLVADFARTTAQWARLAHRAGQNPDDVQAAVRLAAIAVHAAGAELHARLADNPAAVPGLHALGPALPLHDQTFCSVLFRLMTVGVVSAALGGSADPQQSASRGSPIAFGARAVGHRPQPG